MPAAPMSVLTIREELNWSLRGPQRSFHCASSAQWGFEQSSEVTTGDIFIFYFIVPSVGEIFLKFSFSFYCSLGRGRTKDAEIKTPFAETQSFHQRFSG